jgi:hypothetical protein
MFDYGEVLSKAWQITWKYKGLWVLGFLAGCGSGGGGGGGGGGGNSSGGDWSGGQWSGGNFSAPMQQFQQAVENVPVWVWVVLGLVVFVLIIAAIVLGVIGTGGLIAGFKHADEGHDVRLGEAFRMGAKYFWRLLGFRLLLVLFGIVVALIVAAAAIGSLGICLIPLICLGLPLGFAVGVYISLCQVALVDDDLPVTQVFGRVWETVRTHYGPAALMGVILVIGGFVVALVMAIPIFLVMVPLMVSLASQDTNALTTGAILSGVCFVAYLPVLLLLNSVLQTYLNGAWTLTYRRLTGKSPAGAAAPAVVVPPAA